MERVKELLPILACPYCQATLKSSGKQLICLNKDCKRKFPVKDGLPILLPAGLEKLPDATFKKAQVEFFDKWSSKGRGKRKPEKISFSRFFSCAVGEKKINYSEVAMRKLIKKLPKNSWVLELGCGAGEHTAFLSQLRRDIHLVAFDLSLKSVMETRERLKAKRPKSQVGFVVGDVEALPFKEEAFAGVLAIMLFHHLAHLEKTLEEIKRILHPNGVGLIVDLVDNNPFIFFPRKIFPYLPYGLKKRFKPNYLLENGGVPRVSPFKIKKIEKIEKAVEEVEFKILKKEYHDLFLHALTLLGIAFPFLQYLLPEFFLNFLYNIERKLLKSRFFQRLTGAIVLWVSH